VIKKILQTRSGWLFVWYIAADIVCIGMGMGVPFFCILLGFWVGWIDVRYVTARVNEMPQVFRQVLNYAILTTAFTFLAMLALWGSFGFIYLFDPSKDIANTGIPLIFFEPMASFIGWIVLMVVISPFLQLLTTLFTAYLTLWHQARILSAPNPR
jgi:hypothetical protein